MSAKRGVDLSLQEEATEQVLGTLHIKLRPSDLAELLQDNRQSHGHVDCLAPIQLLEGCEYVYEITADKPVVWTCDLPELFSPDDDQGRRGRLKTGLYTGLLTPRFRQGDHICKLVELEVRSRKLDYLLHYRWMLRDLSEHFGELIMQRFAASQQRFAPSPTQDARTLYQRCAYLGAILESRDFEAAMHQIIHRPHRQWMRHAEMQRPGRGLSSRGSLARQFGKAGPKQSLLTPLSGDIQFAPRLLETERQEESRDTPENRTAKFILQQWLHAIEQLKLALEAKEPTGPTVRGLWEAERWRTSLDAWYAEPFFKEVGRLDFFPAGSSVLQKRPGYRELFSYYLQSQAASELRWNADEETFKAGQKNVATLYEYWAFLQLAKTVAEVTGQSLDWESLIQTTSDGLSLNLRQGSQCVLRGHSDQRGRKLELQLWFNRSFKPGSESWTAAMRPDCSLWITGKALPSPVVVHFDAKYRITGNPLENVQDPEITAKNDDLLKMHAYRDAIQFSGGAYVLFPGNRDVRNTQYTELLPGLGAFPLTPSENGDAEGAEGLVSFISSLLTHCAEQFSQHERSRYWEREIYTKAQDPTPRGLPQAPFLTRPPQDTKILLGFARSEAQWEWVERTKLYNLRADSRRGALSLNAQELSAEFVLVYNRARAKLWKVVGAPRLYSREQMVLSDYPHPGGELYLCLPLEPVNWPLKIGAPFLEELSEETTGIPMATTWSKMTSRLFFKPAAPYAD